MRSAAFSNLPDCSYNDSWILFGSNALASSGEGYLGIEIPLTCISFISSDGSCRDLFRSISMVMCLPSDALMLLYLLLFEIAVLRSLPTPDLASSDNSYELIASMQVPLTEKAFESSVSMLQPTTCRFFGFAFLIGSLYEGYLSFLSCIIEDWFLMWMKS